jgi:hypothetical protein
MKKVIVVLLLCVIGGSLSLFAQEQDSRRRADFEKFRIEREAYITKEMDLTEKEAAAFWPLNNELQAKKFELNKELRGQLRAIRQANRERKNVSEADYKKLIETGAKIKIKEAELDETYLKKFLEVVPAEKVYKYQNAENEFARKMMDQRENRSRS